MAQPEEVASPDDVQAQVLQTTLAEIKTSRHGAAAGADPGGDATDCCVICLDSVSDPCAALPCTHANFDFLCLLSWLQEHPNCPLCKAAVYKVRYTDPQNGESFYRVPNAARARDGAARAERPADQASRTHTDSSDSAPQRDFTYQHLFLRGTSRRCARPGPRPRPRDPPRPPPSESEAIQRRRYIYRHQLYSLHIGSNRISQYRQPPTPAQFSSTPHLISRARLWIRRELQVFSFLSDPDPEAEAEAEAEATSPGRDHDQQQQQQQQQRQRQRRANNAEFLLEYIVAILKTVDIQGSAGAGHAEALLADFLGRAHARLFLHELRCWLRSPAPSLAAWDREVQYPEPGRRGCVVVVVPRGCDRDDGGGESASETETGRSGRGGSRDKDRGKGTSWRDRAGGDHWRAGEERWGGKRKRARDERGETDDVAERRPGRPRTGRDGRR